MKRKIIALLLASVMMILTLGLAGCGSETTDGADETTAAAKAVMLDEPFSTEQYGIGFKKGNTELRDAVQAAVYQLYANGTVAEIAAEYQDYELDKMLCLDNADATTFDTENASEEFKARTTLTVGFDAEYPPYGYMDDNGEYTGFDLELAEKVCEIYGWELVKQPIDWDSKDNELNSGSIDVIWNGFTMTGRENDYEWTNAYIDNSIVIVVMDDSGITSVDDLAGKVVVAQTDSSASAALDEATDLTSTFASYELVADYNTAFMNLKSGVVDAIAVDIGVAQYQLANQ